MFQRYRRNAQSSSAPARPSGNDPWRAAGEHRPSEQGVWILSYLDVMTILFAFFVLLFAYQKSTISLAGKPQMSPVPPVQMQAKIAPQTKGKQDVAAPPAATRATDLAVSAMKTQATAYRISRDLESGSPAAAESGSTFAVETTDPAASFDPVVGAAQLASAQNGQWILVSLQKATEGKPVDVVSVGKEVRLEVSEAILFDPASADLSPGGGSLLDKVLPILKEQQGIVFVEGHTDNKPIASSRFPSNWELSTARATAVTRYLIGKGVASERLRAVGLADTHPRGENDSAEGRTRNRRVSLVLGVDQPRS